MIYYNARENIIGIQVLNTVLLDITELESVFRVLNDEWEFVGEL